MRESGLLDNHRTPFSQGSKIIPPTASCILHQHKELYLGTTACDKIPSGSIIIRESGYRHSIPPFQGRPGSRPVTYVRLTGFLVPGQFILYCSHYCALLIRFSSTLRCRVAETFPAVPASFNVHAIYRVHTFHRHSTMQAVPEPRQQSFEEIYGPPENFLEIEVRRSEFSSPLLSHTCHSLISWSVLDYHPFPSLFPCLVNKSYSD